MDKKPSKDRVLALLQILQKHSDEDAWLTTTQVLRLLSDEGHLALILKVTLTQIQRLRSMDQ